MAFYVYSCLNADKNYSNLMEVWNNSSQSSEWLQAFKPTIDQFEKERKWVREFRDIAEGEDPICYFFKRLDHEYSWSRTLCNTVEEVRSVLATLSEEYDVDITHAFLPGDRVVWRMDGSVYIVKDYINKTFVEVYETDDPETAKRYREENNKCHLHCFDVGSIIPID